MMWLACMGEGLDGNDYCKECGGNGVIETVCQGQEIFYAKS